MIMHMVRVVNAVPYKFNVPYITFHGVQTVSWAAGVTGMPSIEPNTLLEQSNRMNFWERVANLQTWLNAIGDPWKTMFDERIIQTHVPEKPFKKFGDIIQDSEMFLLNYEVLCLDYQGFQHQIINSLVRVQLAQPNLYLKT